MFRFLSYLFLCFSIFPALSNYNHPPLKPNIILIYADDLGIGTLGCYGQKLIKTPAIDKLANQGMLFTRCYSSQYCCPARASLLMGVHDSHSHSYTETPGGMVVKKDQNNWDLNTFNEKVNNARKIKPTENEVFLAQLLKRAGYVTGQFGKLDWGFTTNHEEMTRHGWDHYTGYFDHQRAHGFYPSYLWKDGKKLPLPGNTLVNAGKTSEAHTERGLKERRNNRKGKTTYSADVLLYETLDFITHNKQQPFFVFYSTALPHGPVDVPPEYLKAKDYSAIQSAGENAHIPLPEIEAAKEYAAMVEKLDDHVEKIVQHLVKLKLDKQTFIIFTADNGHEIYYRLPGKKALAHKPDNRGGILPNGEILDIFHGNQAVFPTNNTAISFSNLKWSNQEGGIRVPLIAYWPGIITPKQTSHAFIANYDHFASFSELAGIEIPKGKDSLSYVGHLFKKENARSHDYIIIDKSVITNKGWKLTKKGKDFLLYNIDSDPGEQKNLIHSSPKKKEELLRIFHQEIGSPRKDK